MHTSRRQFIKTTSLGLTALPFALDACSSVKQGKNDPVNKEQAYMVYVGTYADADAEGIFGYRLDPATGALTRVLAVKGGANPSFLALDSRRRHLYAVNEVGNFKGSNSGAVSAFAIDQQTGGLNLLSQHASLGGAPCFVSTDRADKFVFVANYSGGNVSVFPIQPSGEIGPAVDMYQHIGKGPHPNQKSAHAHCILPDPADRFFLAVDLGIDQVLAYKLDPASGKLTRTGRPAFTTKAGAGPRILTFHPNGRWAYLICELDSSMYTLAYNAEQGAFRELQHLSTLPADFQGESYCAHVQVSADGRFLYGSNRGHNSLVVYAIDEETGLLTPVQHVGVEGDWPRHFTLDLTGQVLVVANQRSNNLTTFRRDPVTGLLTYSGVSVEVTSPSFVQVVPAFG